MSCIVTSVGDTCGADRRHDNKTDLALREFFVEPNRFEDSFSREIRR